MSESVHPPASGGNLKYGVVGILLLLAALGIWLGLQSCDEPRGDGGPAQASPDAGPGRSAALVDQDLFIPEPEADAGPQIDAGPRIRYVTRYVGGGGSWDCSGAIPPAVAQAELAQHNVQFRNCYERRLKVNNTLEGRLTVRMRVGRDGAVTSVATGGSMTDGEVLSCVRSIAQRIRFPAVTGGGCAVVQAPFNFTPRR